ncbi:hypothetical protein EYF80_006780 [Liparis tanakae]|uniref:Uncharacterized protein n=1 Tax=Liparis tanakae TaxID=230148 RepID=A0A4Z2J048_9TELE|nr:hypothetical protein EYF80_006780 [Liparis tanakae]
MPPPTGPAVNLLWSFEPLLLARGRSDFLRVNAADELVLLSAEEPASISCHAFLIHRPLYLALAGEDAFVLEDDALHQDVDLSLQGDDVFIVSPSQQAGAKTHGQVIHHSVNIVECEKFQYSLVKECKEVSHDDDDGLRLASHLTLCTHFGNLRDTRRFIVKPLNNPLNADKQKADLVSVMGLIGEAKGHAEGVVMVLQEGVSVVALVQPGHGALELLQPRAQVVLGPPATGQSSGQYLLCEALCVLQAVCEGLDEDVAAALTQTTVLPAFLAGLGQHSQPDLGHRVVRQVLQLLTLLLELQVQDLQLVYKLATHL